MSVERACSIRSRLFDLVMTHTSAWRASSQTMFQPTPASEPAHGSQA